MVAAARLSAAEIQGAARRRQRERLGGAANAAAALDTDLAHLYERFGSEKRDLFGTGVIANGTPYRGRTWRAP